MGIIKELNGEADFQEEHLSETLADPVLHRSVADLLARLVEDLEHANQRAAEGADRHELRNRIQNALSLVL